MDEKLTEDDWTAIADRAYDAASAEADSHGLSVFVEVFDDGVRRYESRGVPPPGYVEGDAALRASIAELERFAAATVLEWRDLEGQGPDEEHMPAAVAALVREHHGKPIGTCLRCGKRAPLVEPRPDPDEEWRTMGLCAWGCEGAAKGDPDEASG
jgi:hypothetical protein